MYGVSKIRRQKKLSILNYKRHQARLRHTHHVSTPNWFQRQHIVASNFQEVPNIVFVYIVKILIFPQLGAVEIGIGSKFSFKNCKLQRIHRFCNAGDKMLWQQENGHGA